MQIGTKQRCAQCLMQQRLGGASCSGAPSRIAQWAAEATQFGHKLHRGFLHDGLLAPAPLLICITCGAWTAAAEQTSHGRLLRPCRNKPTDAGRAALRRTRKGLHPGQGRTPAFSAMLERWQPRQDDIMFEQRPAPAKRPRTAEVCMEDIFAQDGTIRNMHPSVYTAPPNEGGR